MGVARNSEPKIVMNGWGGLNESFAPAHLRPGELAAVTNMDLRDGIALSSRVGQTSEHDRAYYPNTLGVKRILRYKSLSGIKKRLVLFGNSLRVDTNDNGQYDFVVGINGASPWMIQYYDVVLFGSENQSIGVYDPLAGTITYPSVSGDASQFLMTQTSDINDGGALLDKFYIYRYTFDIQVGGVFLGETGALHYQSPLSTTGINFLTHIVDYTADTNNDNITEFRRASDTYVNTIPSYVSAINIYRSPAIDSYTFVPSDVNGERADPLRIGSIDVATLRSMAFLGVAFTDYGDIAPGKQIPRTAYKFLPRAKRVAMHKGRLWMSSPWLQANSETSYTYVPDVVTFSRFGANGTEPLVFYPESTIAVGPGEPNEMTVIKSIRQQVLGICKEDRTYAILGADTEIAQDVPDVQVELIDANTGCDAPDSCVEVEDGALMFQSERGVMLWRGASPIPLQYQSIKKTFRKIPAARKRFAVGGYNAKEREYNLFCTVPDPSSASGSSFNRDYLRFNFNNNSWTHGLLKRGVGATCYVNDADAEGHMLLGIDDDPLATFASSPWVMRADSGYTEGIDATPDEQEKIRFSVDTGYQDAGAPWLRKFWKEVVVEFESDGPLSMELWVDNKGPFAQTDLSTPTDPETLVWGVGKWGEKKWGVSSFGTGRRTITRDLTKATLPRGSSIRVILSGIGLYVPTRIYSVTAFYAPEES